MAYGDSQLVERDSSLFTNNAPGGRFYITEQLCACGCGTRMASTIVDRGWQFIRGHKKGAGVVHNKTPRCEPAPRAGKVHAVSTSDVLAFLKAEELLVGEQIAAATQERDSAEAKIHQADTRLNQLRDRRRAIVFALQQFGDAPTGKEV